MRGWLCQICKKWKEPKQPTFFTNIGKKLCLNCYIPNPPPKSSTYYE